MKHPDLRQSWPIHANRDWKIIVLIFATGLIVLSLFAWRIYLSEKIGGGFLAQEVPPADALTSTVNNQKLEAGLIILETRQADFLKIKADQTKLIDPSI